MTDLFFHSKAMEQNKLEELHYHATEEKYLEIQSLLNDGVTLDGKTREGLTPAMMVPEKRSKIEAVELLIKSGEDMHWRDEDGGTLLHYASSKGWLEIVQCLVKKGAVLDKKNWKSETPLIMAAAKERSSIEVIELLVISGADIECRDEDGWTVLHHAASQGSVDIVQYLLCQGVPLEVENYYGETPLILAAQYSCEEVFKVLVSSGANIHCYDHNDWTVLHHAAFQGSVEIVDYLVNQGIDKNTEGQTSLMMGAQMMCEDVGQLVKSGADVHRCDDNGMIALHHASFAGSVKIVQCLVNQGVALNAKNNEGQTPLILGAQMMCEEVVGLLVKSGADVHCCDDNGMTALHHASFAGSVEIVQCLVNQGLDLNAKNTAGKTPLMLGAQMMCEEVVGLLVKSGADVHCCDVNGMTALHYASFTGSVEIIQCLVNQGVVLDMKNSDGKTPLHLAIQIDEIESVECLLGAGANGNIEDNDRVSPFDYLLERHKHLEIIKLCIEKGANVKPAECTDLLEAHSQEKAISQLVKLSTCASFNEFSDEDLSLIYEALPAGQEISDIIKMRLESCRRETEKVNKGVTHKIQAEGF